MSVPRATEITDLLLRWRGGESAALAELMPLVYEQMQEIAGHLLRRERSGHTLQTAALVHEAYLRLADLRRIGWQDRAHFYAMSARMMRRVLLDHARSLSQAKRGGGQLCLSLEELAGLPMERAAELVALDEGLRELGERDEEQAEVVELRFFGGLDRKEIAEVMGISSATVTRRWRAARAWLIAYLGDGGSHGI